MDHNCVGGPPIHRGVGTQGGSTAHQSFTRGQLGALGLVAMVPRERERERERESDVRNLTATFNDGGATQLGPAVSLKSSNRPRSTLR
jgi:hypothetical protein